MMLEYESYKKNTSLHKIKLKKKIENKRKKNKIACIANHKLYCVDV